jgi:hypothetical protein
MRNILQVAVPKNVLYAENVFMGLRYYIAIFLNNRGTYVKRAFAVHTCAADRTFRNWLST